MANSSKSIEENINVLEKIIEQLENPEATLDESVELYKEGTKIIKSCQEMIEKVENEIKIIDQKAKES